MNGCPRCQTGITAIVTHGPQDHRAEPCGCRVSFMQTVDLRGESA